MTEQNTSTAVTPAPAQAITGYDGRYSVTRAGVVIRNVWTVPVRGMKDRVLKKRPLKPTLNTGYLYVTLTGKNGKHRICPIHRLVCEAFHGPAPLPRMDVNHKNCLKNDNRAENLEWATRTENQLHAANHGLKPVGVKSHLHKLTEAQVHRIRALRGKESQSAIGRRFGVSQTCICKIHNNKKWKQLPQKAA